ncbi:MAG TPA: hypothetical protein VFB81_08930, partial [Myxococcales bacterium]|nr:hypothetical protein [Myxococcales bacterium]
GFAATARPLAPGAPLEPRDLLRYAPGNPAVVLSSHLGPEVVRALLLSGAMTSSWLDLGEAAARLAAGMGGGLDVLGYTRASVVPGEGQAWGSESAVRWEASLEDAAAVETALQDRTRRRLQNGERTVWRLRIRKGVLNAAAGPAPSGPPRDVLAELSERFGGGAFGPGHLSLYVDLPMIHESFLDAAEPIPALLPRGQHLFLDAAATGDGLAIRGRLSLIPENEWLGRR